MGLPVLESRRVAAAAAAVCSAILLAILWIAILFEVWQHINTRDGRATFVLLWLVAWIVVAGIASFQKLFPFAGKLALWLLLAPLGFMCLLSLGANRLP
jgi:hypothetical protein